MKKYQSHKVLLATQIQDIVEVMHESMLKLRCDDGKVYDCPKHNLPTNNNYEIVAGDYLVEYENGYRSISPKDAFEAGNHKYSEDAGIFALPGSFGWALAQLSLGSKVARSGWNGRGIFIETQFPDENSKMSSPYIFIDTTGLQTDNELAPKSRVPWIASQTDMQAIDWMIAE